MEGGEHALGAFETDGLWRMDLRGLRADEPCMVVPNRVNHVTDRIVVVEEALLGTAIGGTEERPQMGVTVKPTYDEQAAAFLVSPDDVGSGSLRGLCPPSGSAVRAQEVAEC
jgi:hypothetical protein